MSNKKRPPPVVLGGGIATEEGLGGKLVVMEGDRQTSVRMIIGYQRYHDLTPRVNRCGEGFLIDPQLSVQTTGQ